MITGICLWLLWGLAGGNSTGPASPTRHEVHELEWLQDSGQALELARSSGKVLFMLFSGSDWCQPCMRLETELLETDAFVRFAADSLVLLRVDFPRAIRSRPDAATMAQREALAARYNPRGTFPLIVLLKNDRVCARLGYVEQSLPAFMNRLREALTETPDP